MSLSHYADLYMELHSTNQVTKAALRALTNYLGEREYTHCTSEDWLTFFKSIPRASVATLRRYRNTIVSFFRWISDTKQIDLSESIASLKALDPAIILHEAKSSLLQGHFGSYDDLMDSAERVLNQNGAEPLYTPILCTMITLVWFGVPWRQALDIRKDEITISEDLCEIQARYRIRHPRAIKIIKSYLNAAGRYDANDRNFVYRPSEWLFRSHMSDHVTEESLLNRMSQLNRLTKADDIFFSFDKIRESAVFSRGYVIITNMGLQVSLTPHPALVAHFSKLFELTPSELNETRFRNEAWELFYRWCEKYRSVSTL